MSLSQSLSPSLSSLSVQAMAERVRLVDINYFAKGNVTITVLVRLLFSKVLNA